MLAVLLASGNTADKASCLVKLLDRDCNGTIQRSEFLSVYNDIIDICGERLIEYSVASETNELSKKRMTSYLH